MDAAWTLCDLGAWHGVLFGGLQAIGYDVAFLKTVIRGFSFASRGFEPGVLDRAQARWPVYSRELEPVTLASQRDGVATDSDVLGPARRRMAYFRELVQPQKGTCSLYAHLAVGGRDVGGLMLGRAGGTFKPAEMARVRGLLAPISVGAAAMTLHLERGTGAACPPVSRREGEVLRLVQLGYTNPEIARALGTSPNTVRNQVASLLQKVGASTRSELVGLTLRP